MAAPHVSVIINTDGRVNSLRVCLESLRYTRYRPFEVVVVVGPTDDGTWEYCQSLGEAITLGRCPVRNLSQSRNIAIGLASGELLAFLDDDSIPEPEWLDDLVQAFDDPEVAIAGGFLHDHTGKNYQWTFGSANHLGNQTKFRYRATPECNFPGAFDGPFVNANSVFRRTALLEIGGFDEEFEYYLDESDAILRFIENGWKVYQSGKSFIHHKFMPSNIRISLGVFTTRYGHIKNMMYFSLLHGKDFCTMQEILDNVMSFVQRLRKQVRGWVDRGALPPTDLSRFEREGDAALRHGLVRGLSGKRRLPSKELLRGRGAFAPYPAFAYPQGQRCCIAVMRTYPPDQVAGTEALVFQAVKKLAASGAQVHVLTTGAGHDRVDFESGVWVHRIVVRRKPMPEETDLPADEWHFSRTMLDEARAIAERRVVHLVCAPSEAELAAFSGAEGFRLSCDARDLAGLQPAHS